MTRFLAQRVAAFLAAVVAVTLVVFVALDVLPGDPARTILGIAAEPAAVAALHERLGLDRPLAERYLAWAGALFTGDFGESWTYRVPVAELLAPRFAVTLPLAAMAFGLTVVIGMGLGLLAAARRGRPADWVTMTLAQVGVAVPDFWLAMVLILVFAVNLHWFPAGGFAGWDAGVGPALRSLVLPAVALAAVQVAVLTRITRAAALEVLTEEFVRATRAKGLSGIRTVVRHVLGNTLVPVTAVLGLQVSYLIGGAVVIENVFALPGLGRLLFQSIANRDLATVGAIVVVLSALVIAVNFCIAVVQRTIDPRLARES